MTAAARSTAVAPERGRLVLSVPSARPAYEAGRPEAGLPDAELVRFVGDLRERGFAVLDLGDEGRALCDRVREETAPLHDGGFNRVQDAWRRSAAVKALALHPHVLEALRLAYGRAPFPFQTLNFREGTRQDAHSDAFYFHSDPPGFMCGAWAAIEDVRADAGPLRYWIGSHALPLLGHDRLGTTVTSWREPDFGARYAAAIRESVAAFQAETALLRKGQVLVWAANLVHGGSPVERAGSTRLSQVTHYFFDDCAYLTPMTGEARLPADVTTGGWRWPKRAGKRVAVHPKHVLHEAARRAFRLVHRTRN